MQKVFTVNLQDQIFQIEEDAHDLLLNHLIHFKEGYKYNHEQDDLVRKEEIRIAYILKQYTESGKQVVTKQEVLSSIDVLRSSEKTDTASSWFNNESFFPKRKLYRNGDKRIIGGVCAGIGTYFGIRQIWIIRILFLASLFLFSAGFWIYLLLWIIIPKPRTEQERLEMIGKGIYEKGGVLPTHLAGNTIFNGSNSMVRNTLGVFGFVVWRIVSFVGKIAGVLIIILVIFLSFILLMSGNFSWGDTTISNSGISIIDVLSRFLFSMGDTGLIKYSVYTLLGLPLVVLLILALKLLGSDVKLPTIIWIVIAVLWATGLCTSTFLALKLKKEFSFKSEQIQTVSLLSIREPIVISSFYEEHEGISIFSFNGNKRGLNITDSGLYIQNVLFEIKKSTNSETKLSYGIRAFGINKTYADSNIRNISYHFSQENNELKLSPFFRINKGKPWRGQSIKITIYLPLGKKIKLGSVLRDLDFKISERERNEFGDYNEEGADTDELKARLIGKTLEMTEMGLRCVDCL